MKRLFVCGTFYLDMLIKLYLLFTTKEKLYAIINRHGDMLYMEFSKTSKPTTPTPVSITASVSSIETGLATLVSDVQEDEVDRLLREEDGKIYRQRNEQL